MSDEPIVTVNGVRLTPAQAMTLRVLVSGCAGTEPDPELGETGSLYRKRATEIERLMLSRGLR